MRDGYTAVDYKHYNKDGGNNKGPIAYVGANLVCIWAKQDGEGWTIQNSADDEMDDFTR